MTGLKQPETVAPDRPQIRVTDLVIKYGDYTAVRGVGFEVGRGEHVTLLGPSGCGKTTTLRAIAGLEQPTSGEIEVEGRPVFSSGGRVNIPAEKRDVSMVFQSYAIWPHMTVFENVAYGLRVRRVGKAEVRAAVESALDLVQMRAYADRSASQLSGGQQQRVALARAISFSPGVILFDEPLSNLDAKLRGEMRVELRDLQRRLRVSSLYVTHDQEEALAISDRVIIMNEGRIEQIGTPEDIYDRPRNRFVADFVGSANIVLGSVSGGGRAAGAVRFQAARGLVFDAVAAAPLLGDEREVSIRTAYIDLARPGGDAAPNHFAGTIRRRMFHGDFTQYMVEWPCGELMVRRPPTEPFGEGDAVTISFSPEHCVVLQATASTG